MKKTTTYITLIILAFATLSYGQDLHTPEQLKKLASKSSFRYNQILDTLNPYPYFGREILTNDYYLEQKIGEEPEIKRYPLSLDNKYQKVVSQGDKSFKSGDLDKAEKNYLKATELRSNDARYYTKIGKIKFQQHQYTEAKSWAIKALKVNFVHYPAHLLLAKVYTIAHKEEEAIEAISLAHIYNRNNRELTGLLTTIYKQFGYHFEPTLEYDPQYKLTKTGTDITLTYANEAWLNYGLCKAIWEYEPYYREKMEVLKIAPKWLEEKECLLNLVIGYEQMKPRDKSKFLFGATLKRAVDYKMLDQFILYEIFLVQEPQLAFSLTQDEIDLLLKYLIEVRSLEMDNKR